MDPSLPRSRVECLGSDRSRCGYCKSQYTSANFGVWAHELDVRDYQAMLDAGWRRSGSYLYRPNLVATCCPSFVIRLDASRFKPSSTQKRVLKRLRRHASSENPLSPSTSSVSASSGVRVPDPPKLLHVAAAEPKPSAAALLEYRHTVSNAISRAIDSILQNPQDVALFPGKSLVDPLRSAIKVYPPRDASSSKKRKPAILSNAQGQTPSTLKSDALQLTSNVALMLASAERKAKYGTESNEADIQHRTLVQRKGNEHNEKLKVAKLAQVRRQMELASLLVRHLRSSMPEHQKVVVTAPGFLNFKVDEDGSNDEHVDLMHEGVSAQKCMDVDSVNPMSLSGGLRINMTDNEVIGPRLQESLTAKAIPLSRIGSDASSDKTISPQDVPSQVPPESSQVSEGSSEAKGGSTSRSEAILQELSEGKCFTMELVPAEYRAEAYEIFRKYQMAVHREHPDQCTEDTYKRFLVESPLIESRSSVDPEERYGSYHMHYRLSGTLFAVGVVDILPKCLSAVYLFYDPDFAKLSPGTLSAVKEVEWVKKASTVFPSLRFYYMGYYIHSCPKMRYKAAFDPSEILCEETKNWIPATDAQRMLDAATSRVVRLAPQSMSPAPEAEEFRIHMEEVEELISEARIHLNFESEGVRVLPYRMLDGVLQSRYPEHRDAFLRKIRAFIRLVGKEKSKYYAHVL